MGQTIANSPEASPLVTGGTDLPAFLAGFRREESETPSELRRPPGGHRRRTSYCRTDVRFRWYVEEPALDPARGTRRYAPGAIGARKAPENAP